MGFLPLSYWGNNGGTIVPNGIVFYHTPTSFTGTGQWLDVSGNNNHAYVSGAAMGNDETGWMFNGGQFSTASNSLTWPLPMTEQPSSSFTLQWYGKYFTETDNTRLFWRTTNEEQDLSGSGWSVSYYPGTMDMLTFSGSTNTGGGVIGTYSNGTAVYSIVFSSGSQKFYINDSLVEAGSQTAPIIEFTGSTAGIAYPLTFGKAPLHVRCDRYTAQNGLGKTATWGYIDVNHNYQEGVSGYNAPFTSECWPGTTMYKVSGDNPVGTSNAINVGSVPTGSILEPLINQTNYGVGVSGSINSLLLYNRALSGGEISNNARILASNPSLTPNILPTPQIPTAVTQSATNLKLSLDASNGFWYGQRTWYDISGNGNNLTLSGSCTYDPITGSIGFYGNTDSFFQRIGTSNTLNFATNASASMEVWLKWWGGDDNYYRQAVAIGSNSRVMGTAFADNGYSDGLEVQYGTFKNEFAVPAFDSTHNYTKQNSNNIWRQCVLVKTGTNVDYYVNGVLEDTRSGFSSLVISGSTICIGSVGNSVTASVPANQNFIGEIGIVKVWNGTSLSATDISASFASNRSRFGI